MTPSSLPLGTEATPGEKNKSNGFQKGTEEQGNIFVNRE
jgi:hypothetical protein